MRRFSIAARCDGRAILRDRAAAPDAPCGSLTVGDHCRVAGLTGRRLTSPARIVHIQNGNQRGDCVDDLSLAMKRTEQIIEPWRPASATRATRRPPSSTSPGKPACSVPSSALLRQPRGSADGRRRALTESYRQDYLTLAQTLPSWPQARGAADLPVWGDFNRRPDEDAVVDAWCRSQPELDGQGLAAPHVPDVRRHGVQRDSRCAPTRSRREARRVAYAIMCLAEQNATLRGLGYGGAAHRDARAAAEALILALLPLRAPRPQE